MQLIYFNDELNFGDALNRYIFPYFIPELLDDDSDEFLYGIGTILGLIPPPGNAKKIYVFSSGFGYGKLPPIDDRYEFICVRGPLTAQKLNLPLDKAITDGAVLLKGMKINIPQKEYNWSYIPHWNSELHFNRWEELVRNAGGHYIDPRNEPEFVIQEILKSKLIVAEAMHGAIVADTLRVPWIPVKAYKHINDFKWRDWLMSMELPYRPVYFSPVYSKTKIGLNIGNRLPFLRNTVFNDLSAVFYAFFQSLIREKRIIYQLKTLKKNKFILSDEKILNKKYSILVDKLNGLKG